MFGLRQRRCGALVASWGSVTTTVERWTLHVELRSERRLLVRAELEGKPATPPELGPCSIQELLPELERWFTHDAAKVFAIALHVSDEHWQLETPRAHTAVFFVMSALERELLRVSSK